METIKKKVAVLLIFCCVICASSTCMAGGFHDIQDNVGVDRFAHAGISYIICDQLKRNCGMNDFWAAFTTLCIGAAKEKWIDSEWDGGDFAADCMGVAMYQIKF